MGFAKTLRASALITAAAGTLAGCLGGEPGVYDLSVEEAKAQLRGAKSNYVSGQQTRSMATKSWSNNGYNVRVYNDVSFSMNCRIEFEAVSESQTRLTPNCGSTTSAVGSVPLAFVHSEIDAHVAKILVGKEIDAQALMMKNTATAMKNLPAMQAEALAADAQMRALQAQQEREASDWGSDSSDSFGDDWGS